MKRICLATALVALILSVFTVSIASADGPNPGDGHPTGENKIPGGASVSVVSNDRGVTIFISIWKPRPASRQCRVPRRWSTVPLLRPVS